MRIQRRFNISAVAGEVLLRLGGVNADPAAARRGYPMQHAPVLAMIGRHIPLPSMQKKVAQRIAFAILALAIAAGVRLWAGKSTTGAASPAPEGASAHRATSTSIADTGPRVYASPAERRGVAGAAPFSTAPAIPQATPLQLVVRAPDNVQVGESFEVTVNVEAPGGIRQLAFAVTYNKRVLQLVGSSEGTFTKQGGAPAQFGAEEPSDGNILVRLEVDNGWAIGGTGSVAVLQFQALKAGSSPVAIDGVTLVDSGPVAASTTSSVKEAVVIVN